MNLMNAYVEDTEEFECIYAAYCMELNQQVKDSEINKMSKKILVDIIWKKFLFIFSLCGWF